MRMRYWLSSVFMLLSGLVFYFLVYAFKFTGLLCFAIAAVILVFGVLDTLRRKKGGVFRILQRIARLLLAVFLAVTMITGIYVCSYCSGSPEHDCSYIVVLGAGVNGTTASASLRTRLEAAKSYLDAHPDSIAVLSGCQGNGEDISEAECMFRWLKDAGISEERLWKEERAENTKQNLRFSLDLIQEKAGSIPDEIMIVSSNYHLCRAHMFARKLGVTSYGVAAKEPVFPYFCQMLLREIGGIWYYTLFG